MQYSLSVGFLDAANGAVRRLNLPDGRTLDVTIPPGLRDGHVLRLKGQGMPGTRGGPAGDALIEVSVAPHPYFRRAGNDVVLELPVSLKEAVLGATLEVPTISGKVRMTIPAHSNNGRRLRLAGRGIAGGNQVVELKVVLPTREEPALADFLKTWEPEHPARPAQGYRAAMIRFEMVVAEFPDLDAPELTDWIARGWVVPHGSSRADWAFAEIDVARIRLIRDLRLRMELEEDALTLVLSLLDQVYGLRGTLQAMARALDAQPPAVRQAVLEAIGGLSS